MAKLPGIGMIETRDRCGAARLTGFYSGRPVLTARLEQNIQPGQKRLFRTDLRTLHPLILDWQPLTGSRAGQPPRPDRP